MKSLLRYGRDRVIAVADIRTGSASVALVLLSGDKAKVIASAHSQLSLEASESEQTVAALARQLEEAGTKALTAYAEQDHRPQIHTVYAILHAPWARSETVVSARAFEADTHITDAIMTSLAREAFEARQMVDPKLLIEATVLGVRLNGYATKEPVGKYARHIEAHSILSDADRDVRAKATPVLQHLFPAAEIAWRSGMRTILSVLQEIRPLNQDYLLVDMGLDTTHVLSVRDQELYEQRLVPEGVRTILNRVAPERLPEETLGYIRMLGRDACEAGTCEVVQSAVVVAEPDLARLFGEAFGQIAAARHVPNDLVLLAHPDLEQWLMRFFSRIDFAQFTTTSQPFTVSILSPQDLSTLVDDDGTIDRTLAICAALVNIEARE